ncbi:acetyl-CoA carboxylase, carboxyltransferase subunit beta [Tannockella kyphosi]|uniref:acetyl-CoA carboxylase, carboxyltransferase subunit beta n=1 Tax=Tannockella kyphosi TaxID=2899121 RepID=UPI002013BCF6|nr:acetyl-CoA carboxylase, carboxyltransferase subunit beta [Tannockella kyphosi]
MENIFNIRKEKLKIFKQRRKAKTKNSIDVPEGIYTTCSSCKEMILTETVTSNYYICPKCMYHQKISAHTRLKMVFDHQKYRVSYQNLETSDPLLFPGYMDKLKLQQEKTNLDEAVVVALGKIDNQRCVVCVMDSNFFMASMGSVVGEKITRAIEYATKRKRPIIIFCTSGGARMQEGIVSLMQMAKTSAALQRHHQAGQLYISYITHPTTGGVTASFAMLGDIILAEPKALIGFAGARVIETTIKQTLPEDFQSSEFMKKQGFIDKIVSRDEMRDVLIRILRMHKVGK